MTDLTFKVAKRRQAPITFSIEGDDRVYSFLPPKTAAMVLPMMEQSENGLMAAKAAFDWLDEGLSEDDRAHLEARLRNRDDDFDVDGLEDIVVGLVEQIGARPTT